MPTDPTVATAKSTSHIVAAEPLIVTIPERLDWNAWNTRNGITWQREEWHGYVRKFVGVGVELTDDEWWWYYRAYLHWADGRDERNTQHDALV